MKKPELLAPAGSLEKAKTAYLYGADAVYMGTAKLSLRSRVKVDDNELLETIKYAHSINKKVYTALNIYARDSMYEEVEKQIRSLRESNVDGFIISDGGIADIAKQIAPEIPIHISTQANVTSYHTSNFWKRNGAERIILARELNKNEIKDIKENTDLEIEMFVHGAICYSYSGRCHLSDFLASRCGNLGDCAQSCRWAYNMYIEEKNNARKSYASRTRRKWYIYTFIKRLMFNKRITRNNKYGNRQSKNRRKIKNRILSSNCN